MKMQVLQAIISGQIKPEQIEIEQLIALARQPTSMTRTEYRLLEIAVDMVLIHYLKQAQAYL